MKRGPPAASRLLSHSIAASLRFAQSLLTFSFRL
jgi:hypothetical protein